MSVAVTSPVTGESVVTPLGKCVAERTLATRAATRDIVAFNAPSEPQLATASAAQLDALVGGLRDGESLLARLSFSSPRTSSLSIEILSTAESQNLATARSKRLGRLLDAAIEAGLPGVQVAHRKRSKPSIDSWHTYVLAPEGITLPLGKPPAANQTGDAGAASGAHKWRSSALDAIIFSPSAIGPHLARLDAAISAIDAPLCIEVRLQPAPFDGAVRRQIEQVRGRIFERQQSDAQRFVRDPRYGAADIRLETLLLAGSGIHFSVSVRSKRQLDECDVSALSAAFFGRPHEQAQSGQLSDFRVLYPKSEAVGSFLGIVAAAVGPVLERQRFALLDKLEGSAIGKLKSGLTIRMPVAAPRSHTYVIGRPGSGKSTLLQNLILQDIEAGEAVVLIDPHGDLWADVRDRLPAHRQPDLLLIDMADPALRPELNILELGPGDPAEARARVVDTLYQLVRRMMFSGLTVDATGPMFNKYFRAALLLLLEAEGADASLLRFEDVFSDRHYRDALRNRESVTPQTRQQWKQIVDVDGDHSLDNMTPWITSKLTQLTQSAILRPILAATKTSFDFDTVLAKKQVCLINLSNGRVGAEAAGLLGGLLTHRLEQAAKRQQAVALDERHQASVYFDEFHTFASEFLRPLMAETRKYGLRMTLANQTLSQMVNSDVSGGTLREVLGNCANTVVFAVDAPDAQYLAPRFGGGVDPGSFVAQPNFQAVCQFQTKAAALGPFVVRTLPPRPAAKAKPGIA